MKNTIRIWAAYINNCRMAAYIALLVIVLITVATGARACFNAGAAHALTTCKVYANESVRIVYNGHSYIR